MICRAFGFAAVLLLVGGTWAGPVQAQENLDAGKSPSQLFAGNCSACHKSPRGLLKTIPVGSLPGFLRQHYTTGPDMAGVLAGYLTANGAVDTPSERTGRKHRRSATEPGAAEQAAPDAEQPHGRHGHRSARHKHSSGDAAKPETDTRSEAPKAAAPKQSEPAPTTTQSIPSSTGAGDSATH